MSFNSRSRGWALSQAGCSTIRRSGLWCVTRFAAGTGSCRFFPFEFRTVLVWPHRQMPMYFSFPGILRTCRAVQRDLRRWPIGAPSRFNSRAIALMDQPSLKRSKIQRTHLASSS